MSVTALSEANATAAISGILPHRFLRDPIPLDHEGRYSRIRCLVPDCRRISTAKLDLCRPHNAAYCDSGSESLPEWLARDHPDSVNHSDARASLGLFDVARCGSTRMRDELAFGLFMRGERTQRTSPNVVNALASAIADSTGFTSLLDLRYDSESIDILLARCSSGYRSVARSFLLDTLDELCLLVGIEPTRRYLGIASAGRGAFVNLNTMTNDEFRLSLQRWMNHRLASEQGAPQYIQAVVGHVQAFCAWLESQGVTNWSALTRAHMLRYLDHLGTTRQGNGKPYSKKSRSLAISGLSVFIEEASLNDWAEIPRQARWLRSERPQRERSNPRLMGRAAARQLRDPEILQLVENPDTRLAIQIMAETGLRRKEVCVGVSMDCLIELPEDKWSLRYLNSKSRKICTIPIQPHLASAIEHHRDIKRKSLPNATHLFAQDATGRTITLTLVNRDLKKLIERMDLRDDNGDLMRITPHMFRHQNATEWLENGVPITVIQRLLGHESLTTTETYARLNEAKVREQWEKSLAVNNEGDLIQAPGSEVREAAWIHAFAGGASQALPHGRCGMPCGEACEHANACLYCPLFITTPEYLPTLRAQRDDHERMTEMAADQGHTRIVERNRKPLEALNKLISRLERLASELTPKESR